MNQPNFEEDVQEATNEQLTEISSLAKLQLKQQKAADEITEKLKEANKVLRKTQEQDLPEAMLNAGLEKFTTTNGLNISVSETLYASISKKNKPKAIAWLMDNGQSSLVKEDVNIPFDKGDHERVMRLVEDLQDHYPVAVNETVNTASVKAMIKELLADSKEVPLELFGAYFARKSVIKA